MSDADSTKLVTRNCRLLYVSALRGDIDACRRFLEFAPETINHVNEMNRTPLECAIESKNVDLCEFLIDKGAEVHFCSPTFDSKRYQPLHRAAHKNLDKICALLLKKGAVVNCTDISDMTPLHYAAENGFVEACKVLLRSKADTSLKSNWGGKTALHYAAHFGYVEICEMLLDYGADLKSQDSVDLCTPLHLAANEKIVRMFLNRGADPNAKNKNGFTPLHSACLKGSLENCKLLVEHGSLVNSGGNYLDYLDKYIPYPLNLALTLGDASICEYLLEMGADPNARMISKSRDTSLHQSVKKGMWSTMRLLVKKGANPFSRNEMGETPRMLIRHNKKEHDWLCLHEKFFVAKTLLLFLAV